ncbi:unnamed protein product [Zymoseptoria tritici ST99CH_1A5]|uniref:C3HC-type domain-containing protein n=3 Tax=Zymoseptoria tritici TaxID=1047171 RepID=A0A1X7RFQ0_ZYMT9|nr:unnamed protein product [Zymoseptoria tritici ST99CH_3D7]SMR42387.1 unnamed protein product [Zymoseptoria tritici ST99CH_1E4]SMR44564.1 unnamed protein product [Zymoseptoria tritici ST99CH_3D1]SMY19726.1 unnamed protein product [Zymoseptoria tritici ST99CH_1A5]
MPEAIATTKRKFYKALDAITNPSQSSLKQSTTASSTANEGTPSNKRSSTVAAAFDEARERARKRIRQSTSTTSLSTLDQRAAVISIPRSKTTKDTRPPPNFAPWSQESFLARLKTFSSVSQWHPKPDAINEVEWAKRGWVCVDLNTVSCKGGCGKRVVVSLDKERKDTRGNDAEGDDEDEDNDEEAAAFEQALSERYRSQIISGHALSCMWHKAGCKDDIYRLHIVRPSIWQPELRNRCQSLRNILPSIQNIKTRPLDDSSDKLLRDLPKDILGIDATPDPKAFQIALHGWRGSSESGTQLLHCDACFQRIGLWMYQPDYHSGRPNSAASHADVEVEVEDEEEDQTTIDLVDMHRDHCPWRSADSQSATGSLAGLNAVQILHRVVSTCARDFRRRSEEHTMVIDDSSQRDEEDDENVAPVVTSREETERQDKERESKLRKLKNLFNFRSKSKLGKVSLGNSAIGKTVG